MEKLQNLPFERNRYYSGKMLTSADFQAEQDYFNSKRRFMNQVTFGDGIACGLNVVRLDDQSVLVESGTAIDPLGREIVVDRDIVRKLSAIEGFEKVKGNSISLILAYDEAPMHAVYAINSQTGDHTQYNRISENYKLMVIETEESEGDLKSDFFTSSVLLETEDYRLSLVMPSTVCKGMSAKASIILEKLSDSDKLFSYSGVLQVPSLENEDGCHELIIDFEDVSVKAGEHLVRDYWLYVQECDLAETTIVLKAGSVRASIGGMYVQTPEVSDIKIKMTADRPGELIAREIGKISLETRLQATGEKDYVVLGNIKLERSALNYMIEDLDLDNCRKYINMPCDMPLYRKYADNYSRRQTDSPKAAEVSPANTDAAERLSDAGSDVKVATGVLEIPVSDSAGRGSICYSGEIVHGLGKGNVYIEVGYERIASEEEANAGTKSTIYGNPSFFADEDEQLGNVETAVKVLNDKGSFVVAARLNREISTLVLTYHWVAIKFPSDSDIAEAVADDRDKSIQAETPTVLLGTKASHYFGVRFRNMEKSSLTYSLSEIGTGEITADGVYTAPSKEGVYEIKICCTDNPAICTYAYAIVKRNLESETSGDENGAKKQDDSIISGVI